MGGSSSSGGRAVGGRRSGAGAGERAPNASERRTFGQLGIRVTDRGFVLPGSRRVFKNPELAINTARTNEQNRINRERNARVRLTRNGTPVA